MPYFWLNLFATNRALYLSISPKYKRLGVLHASQVRKFSFFVNSPFWRVSSVPDHLGVYAPLAILKAQHLIDPFRYEPKEPFNNLLEILKFLHTAPPDVRFSMLIDHLLPVPASSTFLTCVNNISCLISYKDRHHSKEEKSSKWWQQDRISLRSQACYFQ